MAEKSESKKAAAAESTSDPKPNAERARAVDAAILTIEKQFGRGAIMKLGSAEKLQVDAIPTGSIALLRDSTQPWPIELAIAEARGDGSNETVLRDLVEALAPVRARPDRLLQRVQGVA